MTQKERVYSMLKNAGPEGVRSDEFYKAFLPRAVARVYELREEGHNITSTPEKQFVRYRLAGVGAGHKAEPGVEQSSSAAAPHGDKASVNSSESLELLPETPYERMQDAA